MFCKYCGAEISDDGSTIKCGAPFYKMEVLQKFK